ncbi:hypothetical protein C8R45DRAFT_1109912 [Mycena sanguinolenta]|nr:hypothetical protein C8R45DRAFT_1109912 [Mycena sanguinolenta]
MVATPWFWYMLGQAWIHLPTIAGLRSKLIARNDLTWYLVQEQVTDPANITQLQDGVGGNLAHLARLVVSFIDVIVPADEAGMHQTLIDYLKCMLTFVGLIEPVLQNPVQTTATAILGPLGRALLAQDVIPVLIKAICALSNSSAPLALAALGSCFDLLAGLFLSSDGYATLPEAIDAGLLRALIISAQCSFADDAREEYLLRVCATHEMWTEFLPLANERLEVLAAFDSNRASRNVKACDNLQCSSVDVKNVFQRCSGCLSFYYCSQICQTTDWRHGGHRKACSSYGKLSLSAKNDEESTARQRSFLRALVHHDSQKETLLSKQTSFMNTHPGEPFLTIHDYSKGRVKMWIKSVRIVDRLEDFRGIEWKSILSRALSSKTGIHVIGMYEPQGMRRFAIPLRTNALVAVDSLAPSV